MYQDYREDIKYKIKFMSINESEVKKYESLVMKKGHSSFVAFYTSSKQTLIANLHISKHITNYV
jgi:hypothetical protein